MTNIVGTAGRAAVGLVRSGAQQAVQGARRLAKSRLSSSLSNLAETAIFGPIKRRSQGPQFKEFRVQTASEGVGIPRLYGRQRIAGQIIWTSDIREVSNVNRTRQGGKGFQRPVETEQTTFSYTLSLAIGLCEGEISRIGRVWADGEPISLQDLSHRIHFGTEEQSPDPLIEIIEGPGPVPAFRGLAYIVFENLPLGQFGNRIPQFHFEVERPGTAFDPMALENLTRAVTLIPGSGESVYHTEPILVESAEGVTRAENAFSNMQESDFDASLDHLTSALPRTQSVELIVSWFGTDLRAGECLIEPRVETKEKKTIPHEWSVNGLNRQTANEVTKLADESPAYGGTPSDEGVRQAITNLKARGLDVVFYPFILMDVPDGAGLPDPYGAPAQAAYPWRGRITAHPLATADKTAAARTQVQAFFDRYREMVLHYAQLCRDVGGVDAFLVGSELRGLTSVRDHEGRFPGVEALIDLVRSVRSILGPDTKISYAADWSEYSNYRPGDGSGDVLFHLDELWGDPDVDFVGIDNYMPLSDWRAGNQHLDALAGAASIYDREYLQSQIRSGEGYDYFYASEADRDAQTRTPIQDTAYGEDWVFRYKDLWSWWSVPHENRPGGVKSGVTTSWVPMSKPIWMTELGCSSTDKGPNQPNVFFDPKSSESGRPYFSNGERDDMIQRRFLEAHLEYWADTENNPLSPIYGGPMVDQDRIYLYTWDARPFPDFPVRQSIWSDAENWVYGHWLNGRVGRVPLSELIHDLGRQSGLENIDASTCQSLVTGYMIPEPMAARDAMEPLFDLYQLDAVERGGVLIVQPRFGESQLSVSPDGVIDDGDDLIQIMRGQETDLPVRLSLTYTDSLSDYDTSVAEVRDPTGKGLQAGFINTAVVLEAGEAEGRLAALMAEARAMRTSVRFALPSDDMAIEPSDVVSIDMSGVPSNLRLTNIQDGVYRQIEAVATDPGLYQTKYTGLSAREPAGRVVHGPVVMEFMDIPLLPDGEDGAFMWGAGFADPWPGEVAIYRGEGAEADFIQTISSRNIVGRLESPLDPGPVYRWDEGASLHVRLSAGGFSSLDPRNVLSGEGRLAVRSRSGEWELMSYRDADLQSDGSWVLRGLLRGQRGTEVEASLGADMGARLVVLDGDETPFPLPADLLDVSGVWQSGPISKQPGRFPFRSDTLSFSGISARPFSPVHLAADMSGDDLSLSWTRRTRIGGDNWELEDVPIGENREQYQVIGYDEGGVVVESLTTEKPFATMRATGVASITVQQVSDLSGPGRATRLEL